jgi:hypothetical protein
MSDMTPEEIMAKAKELYEGAQSVSSVSGARKAAMTAASLVYYLAKLHVTKSKRGDDRKSMPFKDEPPVLNWGDDEAFGHGPRGAEQAQPGDKVVARGENTSEIVSEDDPRAKGPGGEVS